MLSKFQLTRLIFSTSKESCLLISYSKIFIITRILKSLKLMKTFIIKVNLKKKN